MKFKEFYYEAESRDIHEGPQGRKVGEFLGGLAGLAGPALAGSAISGEMMGGDMFDKHGAPGGIIGTGLGVMKGRHLGTAIGGAIGDKIGDGMGWLGKKLFGRNKKKPSGGTPYFTALTGGRDLGNPDDVVVSPDKSKIPMARDGKNDGEEHLRARAEMDAASKTLSIILGDKALDLGYSPNEIMQFVTNVGDSNRVLRAWKLHKFDQMVADALKAGHPGTARMMGKRGIEMLQDKGILPRPSGRPGYEVVPDEQPADDAREIGPDDQEPDDDVEVPNIDQPTMHPKRVDLFGDELTDAKPKSKRKPADPTKPKRKRPSRAKPKPQTPGLFD